MERFAIVLLLCLAPAAHAQHVYKCTSGKDAPPDAIDPAILRQNQYNQQEMDRRSQAVRPGYRAPMRATGASIGLSRNQSECDAAKAQRAAAYERMGSRRTFEQSRFWDNRVYDACR